MWFLTEDGLYEVLMQNRKPITIAVLVHVDDEDKITPSEQYLGQNG